MIGRLALERRCRMADFCSVEDMYTASILIRSIDLGNNIAPRQIKNIQRPIQ
jgi:hypothetical protein